jgi:hypothetical protein
LDPTHNHVCQNKADVRCHVESVSIRWNEIGI